MVALAAFTSQLEILAAERRTSEARTSQLVILAAVYPPQSERAQTSQIVELIWRSGGSSNVAVQTSQLVELIAYKTAVPQATRSRAWTFVLDGHTFYVLDIGEEGTFVYDDDTNQWWNASTQGFEPQWNFINGTMWQQGRIVGADMLTNEIWELVPTAVLDEGWRDIAHVVTGAIATRNRVYVGCDALRLSASVGQLDEVNGAVMTMRYSDDWGQTWSDDFTVDLIVDDFSGEIAYRSLGSFMAPGRIFELSDSGGLIRIDGADLFLNGFDDEKEKGG